VSFDETTDFFHALNVLLDFLMIEAGHRATIVAGVDDGSVRPEIKADTDRPMCDLVTKLAGLFDFELSQFQALSGCVGCDRSFLAMSQKAFKANGLLAKASTIPLKPRTLVSIPGNK
jgi:hypothetical protein